jgi:hypothetical protein
LGLRLEYKSVVELELHERRSEFGLKYYMLLGLSFGHLCQNNQKGKNDLPSVNLVGTACVLPACTRNPDTYRLRREWVFQERMQTQLLELDITYSHSTFSLGHMYSLVLEYNSI